ncbi:MAG: hypothetical protein QOF51_3390 [Chloroflexota bacterium]|jgi:uncharacterized membrane protein YeaQ/YmgE (transglycosylase-associated protein family)|nr:hypothetical protein [Chloroflexota bacterium]
MPLIAVAFALLILIVLSFVLFLTAQLVGLLLHLLMAGLIGALAEAAIPGTLRWGWLGAIVAGLVGSWIGELLLGRLGPALFGVRIIPAFVGAVILVAIFALLSRGSRRQTI